MLLSMQSLPVMLPPFPTAPPSHSPPCCSAYSQKKIQENVQCEIMHCIVEEATDSYRCGQLSVLSNL